MNENIYNRYIDILSKDEYLKIEKSLMKNISLNEKNNKLLEKKFNLYINSQFKDLNRGFNLILPFVNNNIENACSVKEAEKELIKLCHLFNKIKVFPNPELIEKIISNCEYIKNNLKLIVDANINLIKNNNIDYIYENEILISFINVYAMINGIEFEEFNYDAEYSGKINDLQLYYKSIPKEILTKEQERELAIKMSQGNSEARRILIERNLKFALKCTESYIGKGLEFSDIVQEANCGLIVGIDKFDVSKGYSITTYVYHWIRHYMHRATLNNSRTIRLPINFISKLTKYKNAYEKLYKSLEREPSVSELCDELEISELEVMEIRKHENDVMSINVPAFDDGEESDITDFYINPNEISVENQAIKNIFESDIRNILDELKLKPVEKDTILMRYGFINDDVYTLNNVGEKYNLTRERIRQIEEKVINLFRETKYREKLVEYTNNPKDAREEAKKQLTIYNDKKRGKVKKSQEYIMRLRNNL